MIRQTGAFYLWQQPGWVAISDSLQPQTVDDNFPWGPQALFFDQILVLTIRFTQQVKSLANKLPQQLLAFSSKQIKMAQYEDFPPVVIDNGSGMCKGTLRKRPTMTEVMPPTIISICVSKSSLFLSNHP
jgi:hypothetical protein